MQPLSETREGAAPPNCHLGEKVVNETADNALRGVVYWPKSTTTTSPFVAGRDGGRRDQGTACTHAYPPLTRRSVSSPREQTDTATPAHLMLMHELAGHGVAISTRKNHASGLRWQEKGVSGRRRWSLASTGELENPSPGPLQWEGDGKEMVSRKGRSTNSGSLLPGERGIRQRRRGILAS
ncbi:LOW QUALITY PROTEIN: hypothetical protein CVT26_011290 [Gymnopilus dilepis]|uniref:Uncharacterized protein n=1 Tax=Gymnopilus dilepis TaxID=231916 RepID=A0A409VJI3_9AGAR|nr:LOW QUALITY PROTEIN: hypothetical protein CVT26_011290 [Gymnopilus dilepis]